MMRVLLVNPPRDNEIIGNNPVIVEEERGFNPPLGLLYVAAYLETHRQHQVEVIDAQVEELDLDRLGARMTAARPDVIGLTAMTMTLIDVLRVVALARELLPEVKVVLGGPHVHLFPDETIDLPGVDFVVMGEGEEAFARLLDHIDQPGRLTEIPGLVFRDGGLVVNTGQPPLVFDLDALPFPARHLVPYTRYSSLLSSGRLVTTIFTSRGCPFSCRFCDRPHLGKSFRARSAGNVVDEIQACVDLGIGEFLVYDDTFTVNRRRVIDICNEIIRRRLDVGFDIRARVDTVSDQMLDRLKAAGCQGIHYGVEAGSPAILANLDKGITLEQVRAAFELTRRHRIPILAYFMIGNPGETRADIEESFRLAHELKPDYVHMTVLTPFPGTAIYTEALARGIIERDVWRDFARRPDPSFQPPHWGEHFTRDELNDLLVRGYKRFYLRPRYILKRILNVRSFAELRRKARAGMGVLGME